MFEQTTLDDIPDTLPPLTASAVTVARVRLAYGTTIALEDVSLDVAPGEILFLLGPSGSGKSSMLRIVAGLERPTSGRVSIGGADVVAPGVFVEPEDRHVGMVFQDYALFPHLTVAANVAFGVRGTAAGTPRAIGDLLDRFGVGQYAGSYPHMLSGGERQRVALARALAPQPRILLMDEPFSGLDSGLRDRVRGETLRLLRELGTTTIVVTHDPQEALLDADRIALLRAGRVAQCGTPDDLYHRPATPFAARFFGAVNELPSVCRGGVVETPLGRFSCRLPDGAAVRVCIRPHHLRPATGQGAPALAARVLRREFLGPVDRLAVAVAGCPEPLSMLVEAGAAVTAGDTIAFVVDRPHVGIVPDHEP